MRPNPIQALEADDIIGTVARRGIESGLHVSVVSPDKDFFQLLGPRVRQLRPNGRNGDGASVPFAREDPDVAE